MIEKAVNGKFKHVRFKLFKQNLDGTGLKNDCVATYKKTGAKYPNCSTGEKIKMGVDIRNNLSKHYGIDPFLFVDNIESLTSKPDTDTQVIGLCAVEGVKELAVEEV